MMQIKTQHRIAKFILLLGNMLILFTIWLMINYDNVTIDQLLYQLKSSASGVDHSLGISAFLTIGVLGILNTILEIKIYRFLTYRHAPRWLKIYFNAHSIMVAMTVMIVALTSFGIKMQVVTYAKTIVNDSDFIEDHYVDPNNVELKFPAKKRNLIYIYLESMESTYADTELPMIEANYIQELSDLANDNLNFSNNEAFGGMLSFVGTTWTAASMVSQTSGVNIKVPLFKDSYNDQDYMPRIVNLGDILEKAGYNQTILMGSDAGFANRDTYFRTHGNYKIVDLNSLKEEGRLAKDYRVWWGFEDAKLFEYAKEEILELAAKEEAFNFTMLTADTHFPDGYLCEDCLEEYDNQYANVIRCSSRRVKEFIDWLKTQAFYDNTTIIITGDHLTMDANFFKDIDKNYVRTVYNCIINAEIKATKEKERLFGTFDMFPTTLAALNVEIEGNRLGLGTNLFASEKTLAEIYGYQNLNDYLNLRSDFYFEKFFK